MKLSDVEKVLANGKSQNVDFFADENWEAIAQTACAFANASGGTIVLGAEERLNESAMTSNVRLDGVPVDRGTYRNLDQIGKQLHPTVKTEYDEVETAKPGFSVFVITVAKSQATEPVSLANGNVLTRKGAENAAAGIFKPKTAAEHSKKQTSADEQTRIVKSLLATEEQFPTAKWLSEQTGLPLDRIEGHLERLKNAGAIRDTKRTSSGLFVTVTQGNRLTLEEMLEGTSEETAEVQSEGEPPNEPPRVASGIDDPSDDDDDSPSEGTESVVDEIGISDSTEATVVPAPIGGRISISRASSEVCLHADDYAEIIANLLASTGEDESMTLAIFGHWGRGKTFQIERVCKKLGELPEDGPKYQPVWFSAWRYRTTPETWAYLFEQFLSTAKKTCFELPWRAALHRRGAFPLICALVSLSVALLTVSQRFSILIGLVQLWGAATVLYLGFKYFQFRTVAVRLFSLYSFAGHADKLGMQAAIGDDLKALLEVWIPDKDFGGWLPFFQFAGKVSTVVALSALISFQLSPQSLFGVQVNVSDSLDIIRLSPHIHEGVLAVLFVVWSAMWIGGLCLFFPIRQSPNDRILLVVDDLDRCQPEQMLEIIESTMLILDCPEIKKRLQVAMLVDECAFQQALVRKYRHFLHKTETIAQCEPYDVARVVRENQEKFFLMQLRLPTIQETELKELTSVLAEELVESEGEAEPIEQPSSEPVPVVGSPLQQEETVDDQEVCDAIKKPEFTKNVLERAECDAVTAAMKECLNSEAMVTVGPRTIKCLLHRYQLAREILRRLDDSCRPPEIAKAVVQAYVDGPVFAQDKEATILNQVARQVS